MEKKPFKTFNKDLSWSTKLYVLMVFSTIALSIYLEAWNNYWFPTILIALAIVSLVDFLGVAITKHPDTWRMIGWLLLMILLAIVLISGLLL